MRYARTSNKTTHPPEVRALPCFDQKHWNQLSAFRARPDRQHVAVAYLGSEEVGFIFADLKTETDDRENIMVHRIIWQPQFIHTVERYQRQRIASQIGHITAQWVASRVIEEFHQKAPDGFTVTYQMAVNEEGPGGRPTANKIHMYVSGLLKAQGLTLTPYGYSTFTVIKL